MSNTFSSINDTHVIFIIVGITLIIIFAIVLQYVTKDPKNKTNDKFDIDATFEKMQKKSHNTNTLTPVQVQYIPQTHQLMPQQAIIPTTQYTQNPAVIYHPPVNEARFTRTTIAPQQQKIPITTTQLPQIPITTVQP